MLSHSRDHLFLSQTPTLIRSRSGPPPPPPRVVAQAWIPPTTPCSGTDLKTRVLSFIYSEGNFERYWNVFKCIACLLKSDVLTRKTDLAGYCIEHEQRIVPWTNILLRWELKNQRQGKGEVSKQIERTVANLKHFHASHWLKNQLTSRYRPW